MNLSKFYFLFHLATYFTPRSQMFLTPLKPGLLTGFPSTLFTFRGLWNSKVMSDMESIADFQFERKKSMYTKQADQKSKDGAYDWA